MFAKEEPLGLLERIDISDIHRFDHIARRKPRPPKPSPYTPVPGRRAELARLAELRAIKKQLLNEDYTKEQQKRSLIDRLHTPPPPLIDRIEASPLPVFEFKPTPSDLHLRTKTVVHRTRDYTRKFFGTSTRLRAIFENLDKFDLNPEVREALKERGRHFNSVFENLEARAKELTKANKWKKIQKDLKAVGKISFKDLKGRFEEICNQLLELGDDWLVV